MAEPFTGRDSWTAIIPASGAEPMRATVASLAAAEMGIVRAVVVTKDVKTAEAAMALGLEVAAGGPGYAAVLNAGMDLVKTRYAFIIAPGIRLVTPFGVSELCRVSDDMKDSGIIVPAQTGHLGGRDFYRAGAQWEVANIRPRDYALVAGLIPMEIYEKLGPFDETYSVQDCVDYDFALRALAGGLKVIVYQRVIVDSPRMMASPQIAERHDADWAKFVSAHREEMLRYGIR